MAKKRQKRKTGAPRRARSRKFHCGPEKANVKTCHTPDGRTVRVHSEATKGTLAKRRASARRLRPYRFTKADARACGSRAKAGSKGWLVCMGARVKAKG